MDNADDQGRPAPPPNEQEARATQANRLYQTAVMLIHGRRKAVDKAIKCIQKAITLIDTDHKYWQLLGEAYYQRGSLNPSINCFIKSLTLAQSELETLDQAAREKHQIDRIRSDCTYSRLRMSDIRLSVLHLDEASAGYGDIIQEDPNNVAALVGLARAELQRSRACFSSGLVKSGHSHCMAALNYSLSATKLSPHLCLTWKLASDCCLTQFICGQRGEFATSLEIHFPGLSERGRLVVTRLSCIQLAQQFLCKALAIEPFGSSGCLWHNLGVSLYLRSTVTRAKPERDSLLKRSLKCLFKALDKDRSNSQIKNTIGVVAFHMNYLKIAQSFIIKSIQSNLSTSETQFSNLGFMYLQQGDFDEAGVAFCRCQAEEPLYCRSWLGNALISERHNIDNLSLLRHCHRLENNYEAQLLYATKVTSLAHSEEFGKDVINALDCMQRVVNYDEHSFEINNTLGLLYERSGQLDQARRCFQKSHQLAPQDSRITFNRLRLHRCKGVSCDPMIDACESSAAREGALVEAAERLASKGNNREHMLNFVYFLFMNRDFRRVSALTTKLLERTPTADVKCRLGAHLVLALAAKAQGDDFKVWLQKKASDNLNFSGPLANRLCLMLLATTTNDNLLVAQVSQELGNHLISYVTSRTTSFDQLLASAEGLWLKFYVLISIFCLDNQSQLVGRLAAMYPTVAELWLYLGLSLVLRRSDHRLASTCLTKATRLGLSQPAVCHVCDLLLAIVAPKQTRPVGSKANRTIPTTSTTTSQQRSERVVRLSSALNKHPEETHLWGLLKSALEASLEKSPKRSCQAQTFDESESRLFELAIDNVIKLVAA